MRKERRVQGLGITTAVVGALLLLNASAANAQSPGGVTGRVFDQTGAVLPGVTIDLVTAGTELTTTTRWRRSVSL